MNFRDLRGVAEQTRKAGKILVVDLGHLGDAVHLVPALWEIKRHHPGAELHVVTSKLGGEVLELAPCVDRIWRVNTRSGRTWREQWRLIANLRREKFDAAFDFVGKDRTTILIALTGARLRVMHDAGHRHFWTRWLVPNGAPRQDPNWPKFEQFRGVLAACGFELEPPKFALRVRSEDADWAAALAPAGAMHISINTANPLNQLPVENNAAILRHVWRQFPELRVVATAASNDRERRRCSELAGILKDDRLQIVTEDLTIRKLAAVLGRCRLHLGANSGAMHLAVAVGIPTVSYFRDLKIYREWLPQGAAHSVLIEPCTCVNRGPAPCERAGQAECLARVDPARIGALVCERLEAGGQCDPAIPQKAGGAEKH